jgi:MYXO-CTERM domain-containing protein
MERSTVGIGMGPAAPSTGRRFAAVASAAFLGAAALAGVTGFVRGSAHTFGSPATTAHPASGPVGTALGDTAHLNEDTTADRTIRFQLFASCGGTLLFTNTVSAPQDDASEDSGTDDVSTSATFKPSKAGTYQWVASIITPQGSVEAQSKCGDEPVTLTQVETSSTPTPKPTPTPTPTGGAQGISTTSTTGGQSAVAVPSTGSDTSPRDGIALIVAGVGALGLAFLIAHRRRVIDA